MSAVAGRLASAQFVSPDGETKDLTQYLGGGEPPRGLFIAFEGGEGAGKSTQAKMLADVLRVRYGRTVRLTREPGATPAGSLLREMVLEGGIPSRAELLLFLADRALHVEEIVVPALNRGEVVICDRHAASTIAYQGAGRGFGELMVQQMSMFATGSLQPDLNVLLDITPELGLARAARRGDTNVMERQTLEFHHTVRQSFRVQALRDPGRWVTVAVGPASDPARTATRVEFAVAERLGLQETGEVDVAARR